MTKIVRAVYEDVEVLTNLAIESESIWGFDKEYMSLFELLYSVTQQFVKNHPVYKLLNDDESLIGFFGLEVMPSSPILEYFYIKADYVGMGFGSTMWNELIRICRSLHIQSFEFVTNPEAAGFYEHNGAKIVDWVTSVMIPNQKIPKFYFEIPKHQE